MTSPAAAAATTYSLPPALLAHPLVAQLEGAAEHGTMAHADGVLTWRAWGQGQPTLLLHGSHGGWLHWVRNIAELAVDRRVVAPDVPGYGESDAPADINSAADHAALVARALPLMDTSGEPWDIVAFSLGALIATLATLREPARVRRLVLVDAGGLGTLLRLAEFRGMKGLDADGRREVNRHNLGQMMLHHRATIDDLAVDISTHYGSIGRTRLPYHVMPDKLLEAVREVRAPIDLIWGEHDFPHPDPEAHAAAVRQTHPDTQLRVVPDAGHWVMYERPEAFNATLRDLLAQPVRPPRPA